MKIIDIVLPFGAYLIATYFGAWGLFLCGITFFGVIYLLLLIISTQVKKHGTSEKIGVTNRK